jgi:hypothetical protein
MKAQEKGKTLIPNQRDLHGGAAYSPRRVAGSSRPAEFPAICR